MTSENKIPTLKVSEITSFHETLLESSPIVSNVKYDDFHINGLDVIADKANFRVRPHRKTVHDFLFLTKGFSKRNKGLSSFEFDGPAVFFLPAYQITQHSKMSSDAEGFFCHFDESIFDFLPKKYLSECYSFFNFQSNPIVELSQEAVKNCESILSRLLVLYSSDEKSKKKLIAFYLMSFFEEVNGEVKINSKVSKNSLFRIAEAYKQALTEHIYEYKQISDYANLLNVSANHLNKCVKASVNKTAQDLLKEMMVLEAKSLIKYSNLDVAEIAVKLCDQNPSNFARFFKKQTGMTPKEYSLSD
ncbi:MAG TPA: helix-turn-helix domain-containing protein [Flavobacterium sp.]|nr:helix-turn-helix domain-containing protein [Flavobacterium sp.]